MSFNTMYARAVISFKLMPSFDTSAVSTVKQKQLF